MTSLAPSVVSLPCSTSPSSCPHSFPHSPTVSTVPFNVGKLLCPTILSGIVVHPLPISAVMVPLLCFRMAAHVKGQVLTFLAGHAPRWPHVICRGGHCFPYCTGYLYTKSWPKSVHQSCALLHTVGSCDSFSVIWSLALAHLDFSVRLVVGSLRGQSQ